MTSPAATGAAPSPEAAKPALAYPVAVWHRHAGPEGCGKFAVSHFATSAYSHDESGVWTGSRAAEMKQANEGGGHQALLDDEFSAALEAMIEEIRTQPVSDRLRDLSRQLQEALNRAGKARKD